MIEFFWVINAVEKSHLYPQAPSLTRYEETLVPIPRKKMVELKILDDNSSNALNQLTLSKLCIRLNTLQVSFILPLPRICLNNISPRNTSYIWTQEIEKISACASVNLVSLNLYYHLLLFFFKKKIFVWCSTMVDQLQLVWFFILDLWWMSKSTFCILMLVFISNSNGLVLSFSHFLLISTFDSPPLTVDCPWLD